MPIPTTNATQELPAVNEILASVGQAPVTTLDQTNPDVAIAYDTLLRVSREVQAEGWSFNTELCYKERTDSQREFVIPSNMLQVDFSASNAGYYDKDVVRRDGKLYDKNVVEKADKTKLTSTAGDSIYLDIVWKLDWVDLPVPFQDYITARAATIVSSRIVGDTEQYKILQQKEAMNRAIIMEYETQQGDYTFFGHPQGHNYYNSYQPYQALYR
tara:strand:+ start:255 stop:896 length:642 start_codon:yes stop_codon:yes gene_type:complete